MTVWEPRSVVGFAIAAGWHGDTLRDAVRACWAASRGDDRLISGGKLPNSVRWVGLWQIPAVNGYDAERLAHLLHPEHNAQVAHTLWVARGGFGWLPSRTDKANREAVAVAGAAVLAGPGGTLTDDAGISVGARPSASSATYGAGAVRAAIGSGITRILTQR